MNRETLTLRMLKAAGSEYRRAHHFKNEEFGSGWSDGDASITNVIYNEKTGRARLVDLEIRQEKSLPATAVTPMTCSFSCSIWWEEFRIDTGCRSRFVFCAPTTMPPSSAN